MTTKYVVETSLYDKITPHVVVEADNEDHAREVAINYLRQLFDEPREVEAGTVHLFDDYEIPEAIEKEVTLN